MALWPQYLTLAYLLVAFAAGLHKDSSRYSGFGNVVGGIGGYAIIIGVLWAGGFWSPLGFAP